MVTMLQYMEEQDVICRNVIQNRNKLLNSFVSNTVKSSKQKWIFLATGSSLNAVNSARMYVEYILGIEVETRIPSEFSEYSQVWDKNAVIIGVSQSGRSKSIIEALSKAIKYKHKGSIWSMTANDDSAITKVVSNYVKIDCGEEKIGFVTKGMSVTTLTIMLMALELSFKSDIISEKVYQENISELIKASKLMKEALESSKQWYINNKKEISKLDRVGIISFGSLLGSAKEAETKLTETIRCACIGYEMEEFIHGPNYEVNPNYYLFFIGIEHPLQERLLDIKKVYEAYSSHSYYFGWNKKLQENIKNIIFSEELHEFIAPLVSVVPFQYLSYQLATDRGTDLTIKLQTELDKKLQRKI